MVAPTGCSKCSFSRLVASLLARPRFSLAYVLCVGLDALQPRFDSALEQLRGDFLGVVEKAEICDLPCLGGEGVGVLLGGVDGDAVAPVYVGVRVVVVVVASEGGVDRDGGADGVKEVEIRISPAGALERVVGAVFG